MSILGADGMLGSVPEAGGYFSTVKIVFMVILLPPWLWTAAWINKDAVKVHSSQILWSGLILGAGIGSMLIWLAVPLYGVWLAAYVVSVGSVAMAYVSHRNKRVVEEARVLTADHLRSVLSRRKDKAVEVVSHVELYNSLGRPVFAPDDEAPAAERQAYNLAQRFLHNVVLFRASEVNVVPSGEASAVGLVVDGAGVKQPPVNRTDSETIIDFLKRLADMNVEDRRRPQTGKMSVRMGQISLDMDVATAGTTGGQRLQLKIVQESVRTKINELGLPDDLRDRLLALNEQPGLTIVSAQPGNGVTSTIYSLLRRHDAFMKQIVTLERQAPVDIENITQTAYKDKTDQPGRLASLLRHDPDVLMVDTCGITQAARLICEAAAEVNILLGSRADSAFQALAKWVKVTGEASEALAHLKAVTCQVLLRQLCPDCKQAYRPAKDLLARLNLPADRIEQFYRPPKQLTDEKGRPIICPTCRGTGYYGRTGAFELLLITDEIRDLVVQNASLSQIKQACRRNKMLYLQEQALRKVIAGVTSIEEVVRVSRAKGQAG